MYRHILKVTTSFESSARDERYDRKDAFMKVNHLKEELRADYDFTSMPGGVRGKCADSRNRTSFAFTVSAIARTRGESVASCRESVASS